MEIIGRFTNITLLEELSKDNLKEILLTSSISPLLLEKQKLAKIGVTLDHTDGFIDAVVDSAIEKKTGARSLKTTIENSVKNARWEVLNTTSRTYDKIIMTEKTVLDSMDYLLVEKEEKVQETEKQKAKIKIKE